MMNSCDSNHVLFASLLVCSEIKVWSVSDFWICHVIDGWCQNVVFLDTQPF